MDFGLSSPVQGGQSPVQRTLGGTRQTNTLTLVGLAIGHDIEWIVVVAYQRWTVGAKPDRLCTSLQKRWRSELTEYLRCKSSSPTRARTLSYGPSSSGMCRWSAALHSAAVGGVPRPEPRYQASASASARPAMKRSLQALPGCPRVSRRSASACSDATSSDPYCTLQGQCSGL